MSDLVESRSGNSPNIDPDVVEGFGREWTTFDQGKLAEGEARKLFDQYFSLFDFTKGGEGFDIGCGSGRWARFVAPRVARLHCIDPSDAIEVARRNLAKQTNVEFHRAGVDDMPLADDSQDFGYAMGVLHHTPDPKAALGSCVAKLKPGGQFLLYLYYRLETRPRWYQALWRVSDVVRRGVSSLPLGLRRIITEIIAALVYLPLARFALLVEKAGMDPSAIPLAAYRRLSFFTMRTDAFDRFATRLEHRFTRQEIDSMMRDCGLTNIRFREGDPYWVSWGEKPS